MRRAQLSSLITANQGNGGSHEKDRPNTAHARLYALHREAKTTAQGRREFESPLTEPPLKPRRSRSSAMARSTSLDKMSYAELLKLEQRVEAAIAERRVADAAATKEQLRAMAEKAGFSLNDLFGKRGRKGSGEIKYRNPTNSAETWTGRGRKPNWLVDAVKKGAKLESLRA
jgi:DNA-binding protein H-NS